MHEWISSTDEIMCKNCGTMPSDFEFGLKKALVLLGRASEGDLHDYIRAADIVRMLATCTNAEGVAA